MFCKKSSKDKPFLVPTIFFTNQNFLKCHQTSKMPSRRFGSLQCFVRHKILCSLTATCILSPHVMASGFRNPGKFCLRNPESLALESGIQRKESGILLQTIGIRNPSSTEKDRNPVPEIQNPLRGIQNPILHWVFLLYFMSMANLLKSL